MSSDVLLLRAPFVRTAAVPLGVAMLVGSARRTGSSIEIVDLAIEALQFAGPLAVYAGDGTLVGDHDKQVDAVRSAERRFFEENFPNGRVAEIRSAHLSFDEAERLAGLLRGSPWATRVERSLRSRERPGVVALTVMFAEQVVPSLALSSLVKAIWSDVRVLWGGAHVTALAPEIVADARYGQRVDGFVAGYAETTFAQIARAVRTRSALPEEVFRAGGGHYLRAVGDLEGPADFGPWAETLGIDRTVPIQISRGCAYGKCTFCTYPSIEGSPVRSNSTVALDHAVDVASTVGGRLSFKDAFLEVDLLERVASRIEGRVPWSACTRVSHKLACALPDLASGGCRTLEIGVETLLEEMQHLIAKRQSLSTLDSICRGARDVGVTVVMNYITRLPGEDDARSAEAQMQVRQLADRYGHRIEHHVFEAERRAPLTARHRIVRSWPWSSTVEIAPRHALAVVHP